MKEVSERKKQKQKQNLNIRVNKGFSRYNGRPVVNTVT
jgi:hypothetical protein